MCEVSEIHSFDRYDNTAIAMSLSEEESRIKREEEREEEELARILALSLEEKWMANAKDIVLTDRKTIIMKEFIVTLREW